MITYLFIKYLLLHLKYSKILNGVYKDEHLLENLSKLLGSEFRKDWVGRIYAVFNPHIQGGIFNPNNQIYEYDENGLTNRSYVEAYIMNQLNIAKRFIHTNNLFDMLTYQIKKIDDYDNYLFIMQPITLGDCLKYSKIFTITLLVLIFIGGLIYFI